MGSIEKKEKYEDCLVKEKRKISVQKPNLYKVFLLNDHYTPMDFVVDILERFFQKTHQEALEIMLYIHHQGIGECGIYTLEIAETKVAQVKALAYHMQHPLQCMMQKR